ncbi:MAG TPA: winged helix-turn-helix domain-containing protein, partial [Rhodospirillales bacterium]|nr:winged helix-turn-helix domain-containing protein [Rhodospirillales bacterium]
RHVIPSDHCRFASLSHQLDGNPHLCGTTPDSRSPVLQVADLIFNRERMSVVRADRSIELTVKELTILELLMNEPGKVFSRERILSIVWGYDCDPLTNIVDVYIAACAVRSICPASEPSSPPSAASGTASPTERRRARTAGCSALVPADPERGASRRFPPIFGSRPAGVERPR